MEEIPDLSAEELAKIALAFEYFTCKEVVIDQDEGTSVVGALTGLEEAKIMIIRMAEMYDLQGEIKAIFSCLLVDELIKFNQVSLLVYMEFMHEEVPQEIIAKGDHFAIAIFIHNYHVRRLQRYRVQKYITYLFFGTPEVRETVRPEVLHMLDDETADLIMEGNENLSPEEILDRGSSFYFVRVGELTLDIAMSRYTFAEALHLYMFATLPDAEGINRRIVSNQTTFEELCMYLIESWQDLKVDPRSWVTVEGPMLPLLFENSEEPVSIFQDGNLDPITIIMACEIEGIATHHKPFNLLLEEYTMAQLTPAFSGYHGEWRDRYQACKFDDTNSGTHIEELDDDNVVYYGLRDGTSPLVVYTIEELYHTFKSPDSGKGGTGYCFDPWSITKHGEDFILWDAFSLQSVKRLMTQVLPFKRMCVWSRPLIEECQLILRKKADAPNGKIIQDNCYQDIKLFYQEEPGKVIMVLLSMFNTGLQLMNFINEFESFDEEALALLMRGDPWKLVPDPRFTGRPQVESRNLLMKVTREIMELGDHASIFSRLYVTKYYNGDFHFNYDNDNYEIGNYLNLMYEQSRLSLTTSMALSGGWLMATACYYHKKLTGRWLNALELEGEKE